MTSQLWVARVRSGKEPMTIALRRTAGALAAAAVSAVLVLTPTAAQAGPSPQAESAASWLAGQVPADGIVKVTFGEDQYRDHGLSLDVALAFLETGTQEAGVDKILDGLLDDGTVFTDYASTSGFGDREDSQIAGATSKLATTAQLAGRDATSFGGHDLIAAVERVVVDDGAAVGRASDISDFGDNSNSIGQSFAVRALAGADGAELAAAADYLIKQQCDNGVFRLNMSDAGCGAVDDGDTTSIDTTAFAVGALIDAREAGYGDADGAIIGAVEYLIGAQKADGSFSDTGSDNSNSTGLAAVALAGGGEAAAATKAADFVAALQVASGDNAGAIAYDQVTFDAGSSGTLDDQWRRTTSQAAVGLAFVSATEPEPDPGPVASMTLDVSIPAPTQGDTITVTATGKDADDVPTGDVSDELTLTSSVDTDTIDGNTVRFNHASPHTITATHVPTGTTASITVEVSPAAVDTPTTGTGTGSADDSGVTVANVNGTLPDTGSTMQAWQLLAAAGLIVAGAGLVLEGRRRKTVVRSHAQR